MGATSTQGFDGVPRMGSRIERLDSIRFIAALWVLFSHGALASKPWFSSPIGQHFASGVWVSFDGVSAVMVFFIVSGMCIHLPYVGIDRVPVLPFLARRYVRIGIPLAVVLIVMRAAGGTASEKGHGVLWSIYAELVYYSIYPLLFSVAKRLGWAALIVCSSAISIALVLIHSNYDYVQQFGWLTWLWGLPVWLSGCALAERLHSGHITRLSGNRWCWRLVAWGLSVLATLGVLHSKIPIGYPISMLLFAGFAYPWLVNELGVRSPGWSWLERCGRASYSLYLVHNIILGAITDYFPHPSSPVFFPLGGLQSALALTCFIGSSSTLRIR